MTSVLAPAYSLLVMEAIKLLQLQEFFGRQEVEDCELRTINPEKVDVGESPHLSLQRHRHDLAAFVKLESFLTYASTHTEI